MDAVRVLFVEELGVSKSNRKVTTDKVIKFVKESWPTMYDRYTETTSYKKYMKLITARKQSLKVKRLARQKVPAVGDHAEE